MDMQTLWNPASAAIVVGGTVLATGLRCGFHDCRATLSLILQPLRPTFDFPRVRAQIAAQIEDIHRQGMLRAKVKRFADPATQEIIDALIRQRSLDAAATTYADHRTGRANRLHSAQETLTTAAELAPIFGLAGTLLALSELPGGGIAQGAMMEAIGMAVVSTLYGLLTAHLLLMPLARWIERRNAIEEADRQKLFDWLTAELGRDAKPAATIRLDRRDAA